MNKTDSSAGNCWSSVVKGQDKVNAALYDEIEKNVTLERFQQEVSNDCLEDVFHLKNVESLILELHIYSSLVA